jgi:signal transduction histidine kinase
MENIQVYQDLANQNRILKEIAFLQAHQVRAPIARILGLNQLFDRDNLLNPANVDILARLVASADELDAVIKDIVKKTNEIQ